MSFADGALVPLPPRVFAQYRGFTVFPSLSDNLTNVVRSDTFVSRSTDGMRWSIPVLVDYGLQVNNFGVSHTSLDEAIQYAYSVQYVFTDGSKTPLGGLSTVGPAQTNIVGVLNSDPLGSQNYHANQLITVSGGGLVDSAITPIGLDSTGISDQDPLVYSASANKMVTKHTIKRMRMPIAGTGHDAQQTISNYSDVCQRLLVRVPDTTVRWRLCIANADSITGLFYGGAISFVGVAVGQVTYDAGKTEWKGDFTSAPTQALSAFTTAPPNAAAGDTTVYDYQTNWVTASNLQFQAGQITGISLGWTSLVGDGTHKIVNSTSGGMMGLSGRSNRWNLTTLNAVAPAIGCLLDIRIEYEILVPLGRSIPYVFAMGDSITRGLDPGFEAGVYRGLSGVMYPHQSWAGVAGARNGVHVANLGIGGTTTAHWAVDPSTNWLWSRCIDPAVAKPDGIWMMIGTNDAFNVEAVVTEVQMRANLQTIIANWKALGVTRFCAGTQLPRNYTWPSTYEVDILSANGAVSGTCDLQFTILGLPYTTSAISWNATASTVAAAIQTCLPLTMQAPNTVVGTGGPLNTATPIILTFANQAYGPISDQAVVASTLAGGSAVFNQATPGTKTAETIRVTWNNYLRQGAAHLEDTWDFDDLLADPMNPSVMKSIYSDIQQVHPWRGGYTKMGSIVTFT